MPDPRDQLHDEILAEASDGSVSIDVDSPEATADRVARILIGDGPEARPGELEADPDEFFRRIDAKGRQRAKVFVLNPDPGSDTAEYESLMQRSQVDRTARIIGKPVELIDGIKYAVAIRWIDFDEPYMDIVKTVKEEMMPESRRQALLRKIGGEEDNPERGPIVDDGKKCLGLTKRGKQCSRRRQGETKYCKVHVPPEPPVVDMDDLPGSHRGMGAGA